jgi:hypothetical protein
VCVFFFSFIPPIFNSEIIGRYVVPLLLIEKHKETLMEMCNYWKKIFVKDVASANEVHSQSDFVLSNYRNCTYLDLGKIILRANESPNVEKTRNYLLFAFAELEEELLSLMKTLRAGESYGEKDANYGSDQSDIPESDFQQSNSEANRMATYDYFLTSKFDLSLIY